MGSPVSDPSAPGATPLPPAASQGTFLTDTQFTALVAALKGQSPVATVVADVKAVNSDVLARMEALVADMKGAATGVHGAAKAVQADVAANWPILLVGLMAASALALVVLQMIGVKL